MVYSMITQMFSGEYYSAIVMLAATFALQIMLKALVWVFMTDRDLTDIKYKLKELQTENTILKLRINDVESATYQISETSDSDSDNETSEESCHEEYDSDNKYDEDSIDYLREDVTKLFNIITNMALYTQKNVVGPHNVEEFLDILANSNKKEFAIIMEEEFEKYMNNQCYYKNLMGYKSEYPDQINKQRMWLTTDIKEIIYATIKSKFEPITHTIPEDSMDSVD